MDFGWAPCSDDENDGVTYSVYASDARWKIDALEEDALVLSGEATQVNASSNLRGWDDSSRERGASLTGGKGPVRKPLFGQRPEDEDETDATFALELGARGTLPQGLRQGGRNPAQKGQKREYSLTSLEDKVILIIGFALFLALMLLMILWALRT